MNLLRGNRKILVFESLRNFDDFSLTLFDDLIYCYEIILYSVVELYEFQIYLDASLAQVEVLTVFLANGIFASPAIHFLIVVVLCKAFLSTWQLRTGPLLTMRYPVHSMLVSSVDLSCQQLLVTD